LTLQALPERTPQPLATDTFRARAQAVSNKTEALIALVLGVAVRCDPWIGFPTQVLVEP